MLGYMQELIHVPWNLQKEFELISKLHIMNYYKFRYLHYCLKKLKTLQYFGIQPIFVFDGGRLPMKSQTEKDRRK